MSWNTIQADDVLAEFTPVEAATLQSIQGASDRLAGVLLNSVNQTRGSIAAGGYGLDAAGTVPDQLRSDVIAIARWRWLISFPQMKSMQTDARKAAFEDAIKRLDLVGNQKVNVEAPAGSVSAPSGNWNSENKLVPRGHPIAKPGSQFTPKPNDYANPDGPADEPLI